ncbi:MAG: carboxypeptidase regulatory-like domain-containing protein [Deltaproteobacteria bacterium]|nr:carboxypeptidase regulatory-like domain-containing protein [Deltaproteobacteria bacterium]
MKTLRCSSTSISCLALAVASFAGCGARKGDWALAGTGPVNLAIEGTVARASTGGSPPAPVDGAEVSATIVGRRSEVETSTGDDGAFRLDASVEPGDTLVVGFRAEGMAPLFRTVRASPGATITLDVTLEELDPLDCTSGNRCTVSGNELSITGLAEGIRGAARVFNPVTEAASFPGGFDDSDGNLLISGVFASVELTDSSGESVHQLDEPATLRMRMPRDTWGVVVDIRPDTDRIEVPLYAFDEDLGTWVRDGDGYLEDDRGEILDEDVLPSIRDGSFQRSVVACGAVSHFSYWNVDWPVSAHACISGTILDDTGLPAEGAVVSVSGSTYNGTSAPVTVGPDGRFCVDVMRSEGADDVDQDGIPGETHRVLVRVVYQGEIYDGGEHETPLEQGTCGDPGCEDLGFIALGEATRITASRCVLRGRVVDPSDQPVSGALVFGLDGGLASEIAAVMCAGWEEGCTFFASTAEDGSFELALPILDSVRLQASSVEQTPGGRTIFRMGDALVRGCPAAPVEIRLDEGFETFQVEVEVEGDRISWTPPEPANAVSVMGRDFLSGWTIVDWTGGFLPPVTHGVVPDGADLALPWGRGDPAPMSSGDLVMVYMTGTSEESGLSYVGIGQGVVP